jgi:thiol-disulfide isomerase/thioredoxin
MNDFRVRMAASTVARCAGVLWLACSLLLARVTSAGELVPYTGQGLDAPAFALKGLDGKPRRLADDRGKVVLVNFWASWCPPCLAELPSMQRLADRLRPEAFAVFAINVGESPFRVTKFMKLIGTRLNVLLDEEGETFQAWGGSVYPTSFVLDSEGQVRYVAYGPLEWDQDEVVQTLSGLLPPRKAATD